MTLSLGEQPHNRDLCDQGGQPHLGPCHDPAMSRDEDDLAIPLSPASEQAAAEERFADAQLDAWARRESDLEAWGVNESGEPDYPASYEEWLAEEQDGDEAEVEA